MNHQNTNPVILVAAQDYDVSLVKVNEEAIEKLARPDDLQTLGESLADSPLARRPAAFIPYFIVMNVLNYQFWDMDEMGSFQRYSNNGLIGAMAMQKGMLEQWCAAIGGAEGACLETRVQIDRAVASLRARIENEGVQFILGDIPASQSRKDLLLEVLDAGKLTAAAEYLYSRARDTAELGWGDAQLLAYLFPQCYGDRYLKKAQLTLMFIAAEMNAAKPAQRIRLDVTAAADYQLPKVLRSLGILEYSEELSILVDGQHLIEVDDRYEKAIRAATVFACGLLAKHFGATIEEIDFWLWMNRNRAREAQFHLTFTTAY